MTRYICKDCGTIWEEEDLINDQFCRICAGICKEDTDQKIKEYYKRLQDKNPIKAEDYFEE